MKTQPREASKFSFWGFVETWHPAKNNYPHQKEIDSLERFVRGRYSLDTPKDCEMVSYMLERYGSRYNAEAEYEMLKAKIYMDAYSNYYLSNNKQDFNDLLNNDDK